MEKLSDASLGLALCFLLCFLHSSLLSLTVPVSHEPEMLAHQDSVLDKLLRAIDDAISIAASHEPRSTFGSTLFREDGVCLGNRGLVWDGEHAHPSTENAQAVDSIERLRTSRDHRHSQRATLGRAHTAC